MGKMVEKSVSRNTFTKLCELFRHSILYKDIALEACEYLQQAPAFHHLNPNVIVDFINSGEERLVWPGQQLPDLSKGIAILICGEVHAVGGRTGLKFGQYKPGSVTGQVRLPDKQSIVDDEYGSFSSDSDCDGANKSSRALSISTGSKGMTLWMKRAFHADKRRKQEYERSGLAEQDRTTARIEKERKASRRK